MIAHSKKNGSEPAQNCAQPYYYHRSTNKILKGEQGRRVRFNDVEEERLFDYDSDEVDYRKGDKIKRTKEELKNIRAY